MTGEIGHPPPQLHFSVCEANRLKWSPPMAFLFFCAQLVGCISPAHLLLAQSALLTCFSHELLMCRSQSLDYERNVKFFFHPKAHTSFSNPVLHATFRSPYSIPLIGSNSKGTIRFHIPLKPHKTHLKSYTLF